MAKLIIEAVDLYCPNCKDRLGKDVEEPKLTSCSRCGKKNIPNPRGYDEDE
jgi:hypothetical protein